MASFGLRDSYCGLIKSCVWAARIFNSAKDRDFFHFASGFCFNVKILWSFEHIWYGIVNLLNVL